MSGQFTACPSLKMTGNYINVDFGLMLNFTGMVRVVFAVPFAVLSFSDRGHQVGMLKRSQKNFLIIFILLCLFSLRLRIGYDEVFSKFD